MNFRCPHCKTRIDVSAVMAEAGRQGGKASGKSKRRDVDYAALARLSHQSRKLKGNVK
jgi:hypothetical protein